jgi:hypothetical protein
MAQRNRRFSLGGDSCILGRGGEYTHLGGEGLEVREIFARKEGARNLSRLGEDCDQGTRFEF